MHRVATKGERPDEQCMKIMGKDGKLGENIGKTPDILQKTLLETYGKIIGKQGKYLRNNMKNMGNIWETMENLWETRGKICEQTWEYM